MFAFWAASGQHVSFAWPSNAITAYLDAALSSAMTDVLMPVALMTAPACHALLTTIQQLTELCFAFAWLQPVLDRLFCYMSGLTVLLRALSSSSHQMAAIRVSAVAELLLQDAVMYAIYVVWAHNRSLLKRFELCKLSSEVTV